MDFYTAKSYEGLEVRDPFQEGDKWYGYVSLKTNPNKKIRLYVRPQDKTVSATSSWNYRKGLGFGEKGYIHIFSNASNYDEFFEKYKYARFHVKFGWYVVSDEPLPENLPGKVRAHILPWEYVGKDDNTLKSDKEVFAGVQRALKDPALTLAKC